MNRRSDFELRDVITNLEKMMLSNPASDEILLSCLEKLMTLCGATFGYVFQCKPSQEITAAWDMVGCYEVDADIEDKTPKPIANSCTSSQIPDQLQRIFQASRIISNTDHHSPIYPLPANHPEIYDFLCVPFADVNRVYGVVYLCNSINRNGFAPNLAVRLRPFKAAAGCLLRSASRHNSIVKKAALPSNTLKETELTSFLDNIFNAVLIIDNMDQITACNQAASAMLACQRSELIGQTLDKIFDRNAQRLKTQRSNRPRKTDDNQRTKYPLIRGLPVFTYDQRKILVDVTTFDVHLDEPGQRAIVMEDISEKIRFAYDYHSTLQRFEVLTKLAPLAILQLDSEWNCIYANNTWCEYSEMTQEESESVGWLKGIHLSYCDEFISALRETTPITGSYETQLKLTTALGRTTWVQANACCLYSDDGKVNGVIITMADITLRVKNEERLKNITETDQLTGLLNRTTFHSLVTDALDSIKPETSISVLFLDLDKFKYINDTYGHDAGDELLCEASKRLCASIPEARAIARLGGDEFTILIDDIKSQSAILRIVSRLVDNIAQPMKIGEKLMNITCSIGIALTDSSQTSTSEIIRQADVALYKSKSSGRNQYSLYNEELSKQSKLHSQLRESLQQENQSNFYMLYQPQIDTNTGQLIGIEALSRWSHPEVHSCGPETYIKIIEEAGLIDEFSSIMFEEVMKTTSEWKHLLPPNFKTAINISPRQLKHADLPFRIQMVCNKYNVHPSQITLEVTETAIIEDQEIALESLRRLKRMGFTIALDDFGTGYSSLIYLKSMPINYIKIDRSFTENVVTSGEDAKIVSSVIQLATALGFGVVAEGVENEKIRDWLMEHNCFVQQGYFFYHPMQQRDFKALLESMNAFPKVVSITGGKPQI